jgi:hypothetical protein
LRQVGLEEGLKRIEGVEGENHMTGRFSCWRCGRWRWVDAQGTAQRDEVRV